MSFVETKGIAMSRHSHRALPKHLGRVILRQVFSTAQTTHAAQSLVPAPHFSPRAEPLPVANLPRLAPAAHFDMPVLDKHTEIMGQTSA